MIDLRFEVKLRVRGPFLSRSSQSGRAGLDAPANLSTQPGRELHAAIPGTAVKGLFREALRELGEVDSTFIAEALPGGASTGEPRADLLGPDPNAEATAGSPLSNTRGMLRFSEEFVSDQPVPQGERVRIRRDNERRAVLPKHLLVAEAGARPGEETTLSGWIEVTVADRTQADAMEKVLHAGLRWISSLGAFRSVGYGELLAVELTRNDRPRGSHTSAPAGDRFRLTLSFETQICVSKRRIADNIFESDTEISGTVVKGALAHALNLDAGSSPSTPLPEWFTQLRASFAKPSLTEVRPKTPPASLVFASGLQFCDVAARTGPFLFAAEREGGGQAQVVPRFAVDWKNEERATVDRAYGIPPLERRLRVRTAIDPKSRRAADEMLFAYDMVEPVSDGKPVRWIGELDFGAIPDESARREAIRRVSRALQLQQQEQGLFRGQLPGIGKTKATATVILQPSDEEDTQDSVSSLDSTADIVVRLETPALLCPPTCDVGSYYDAVATVWEDISADTLVLKRFFASQTLVGGYLGRRAAIAAKSQYRAWLLTDAGSTFVLAPKTGRPAAEATVLLKNWKRNGLTIPAWAKNMRLDNWRVSPHQPANGYGEVSVIDVTKLSHAPQASEWIDVPIEDAPGSSASGSRTQDGGAS